jgi:hypothetical protein
VFTCEGETLFSQAREKFVVANNILNLHEVSCGSKHIAAVLHLNVRPGKKSLNGKTPDTIYYSGPSKFATFATDLKTLNEMQLLLKERK